LLELSYNKASSKRQLEFYQDTTHQPYNKCSRFIKQFV